MSKSTGKPVVEPDTDAGKSPVIEPEVEQELEVVLEAEEEVSPEPEPEPEPEVVPEPVVVEAEAEAEVEEGASVSLAALAYTSVKRNSQSVAVMQGRLSELGYDVVRADLRGWFHDNTRTALSEWQADNGLDVTGACSEDDATLLFTGTTVTVNP